MINNNELDDLFAGAEEDLKNAPPKVRLENEIQRLAMEAAREAGWLAFKWRAARQSGVLDVIYMRAPNRICFIEYKQPGGKPSELQSACMLLLDLCGFPNYICYGTEDTLAALARH
jgi:hypothetical protein